MPQLHEDFFLNGVTIEGVEHIVKTFYPFLAAPKALEGVRVPVNATELEALRDAVLPSPGLSGPEQWAYFVGDEEIDTNAAAFGGCPEWLRHPVAAVLEDDDLFIDIITTTQK